MNQSPDTIDTTLSEIKVFLDENNISLDEVTIVGATKNQSIRKIKRALDAGIKDFGDSFESTKYANQLLYYITTQESTIIAFNQIMLVMGALALCIAPLALLLKGVKK